MTYEPIRTEVLSDPTVSDAELKLAGYMLTKPPGFIFWDKTIIKTNCSERRTG